jgi:hypothetical protein
MAQIPAYERRQIVWAHAKRWPPWPAIIEDVHDGSVPTKYVVSLLGSQQQNMLTEKELSAWESLKPRKTLRDTSKVVYSEADRTFYKEAVEEAKTLLEAGEDEIDYHFRCTICWAPPDKEDEAFILICDGCEKGYHLACASPPLAHVPPEDKWFCCASCGPHQCPVEGVEGAEAAALMMQAHHPAAGGPHPPPRRPRQTLTTSCTFEERTTAGEKPASSTGVINRRTRARGSSMMCLSRPDAHGSTAHATARRSVASSTPYTLTPTTPLPSLSASFSFRRWWMHLQAPAWAPG